MQKLSELQQEPDRVMLQQDEAIIAGDDGKHRELMEEENELRIDIFLEKRRQSQVHKQPNFGQGSE